MAGEEQTQGSKLHSLKMEDTYTSNITDDVIKGWNDRRLANNVELTSLIPFVQLIGVFNATEYERMFGHDEGELSRRPVYFTPDPARPDENLKVSDYIKEQRIGKQDPSAQPKQNLWEWIEKKLKSRFIDLFVYEGIVTGKKGEEKSTLNMTPYDGIMMAQYKSQAAGAAFDDGEFQGFDSTGGIGITDLQVDYGKSNALGSRKLNIRLTVNDPTILDEYPEYAKLSTMQGEFIILYGWSNPQIIEGFDATPPPLLLPSTSRSGNKNMMIIPLDNMNTGGYWSAVKLNVVSYDFAFNEMGQLEINVGFMDKTSMMMNSTRISTIASIWKKIMGTGDYDPTSNPNDPTPDFTQVTVTLADGTTIPVADLIANEQNASLVDPGSTPTGEVPATIEDLNQRRAVPFLEALDAAGDAGQVTYTSNKGEYNQEAYWAAIRKREKLGFPYGGPGIRSYEKITVMRPVAPDSSGNEIDNADDLGDEDLITTSAVEEVTAYRVKVVYYYLGWVLEAMRLSLNSQNRSRVREGDTSFNPQFKYLKNESTSQLKSAFQSKISQIDRAGTVNERLQNAIIRLKQKCMPPFKARGLKKAWKETVEADGTRKRVEYWPRWGSGTGRRPQHVDHYPCAGQVIVEGFKVVTTKAWNRDKAKPLVGTPSVKEIIAYKIFPTPEGTTKKGKIRNTILPMRGHRIRIVPGDKAYAKILSSSEKNEPAFYVFKPDWFQENLIDEEDQKTPDPEMLVSLDDRDVRTDEGDSLRTISVIPAGGSPEGFDPLNPIAYKAADRGGRFFYRAVDGIQWSLEAAFSVSTFVMEVDAFRQSDTEIWDLTQRKWYNLYVQYLGNYFEEIMRNRLAELEREGRTVEDIYNEPVDLDFLTSKVFDNWRASTSDSMNHDRWSPCTWPQVERFFPADEDLKKSIERAIKEEEKLTTSIDEEELAQLNNSKTIRDTENFNNNIKKEIEELTGGRYDIGENAAGNEMLMNFKNWNRIEQGSLRGSEYKKITEYEADFGVPQVKLEWIIWKQMGIPTDNFTTTQMAMGFLPGGENLQSNWKNRNPDQLKELETLVKTQQTTVDNKLTTIHVHDNKLKDENDKYLDIEQNIEAMQVEKNNAISRLARYNSFITEEGGERELSPYDDTSDFDDVLEVDMGRQQLMQLTTKVAQQWYKRFTTDPGLDNGQGYNWMFGVTDISNYGGRPGGTKYFRPSRWKGFQFDIGRRHNSIKGQPRIVLDLEKVKTKYGTIKPLDEAQIFLTKTAQDNNLSWRYFGIGGVPEEDGRNEFGFLPGDREIDEQTGNNIGGDHFADYNEFLDLFGLAPPDEISSGPFTKIPDSIVGNWPAIWPLPGHAPVDLEGAGTNYGGLLEPVQTKNDPFYYMVDDINNIIMAGPEGSPDEGWFVQTGWYLGYGGRPVYLYPSKYSATQIDRDSGEITKLGNNNAGGSGGSNRMGETKERENWRSYGTHYRIYQDEHNIYLTLDEKRSLVFQQGPRTWGLNMDYHNDRHDYDGSRGATYHKVWFMGKEQPSRGAAAPGQTMANVEFDWSKMGGTRTVGGGKIIREGAWDLGFYNLEGEGRSRKGNYSGTPVGRYLGPTKKRTSQYSNPDWPYGTGYYQSKSNKVRGSHQSPTTSPSKHVLLIGDLIEQFPNKGFFTTVNNDNYSSSTITPDGNIVNGKELNVGFVEFILHNVYAPIGKNRRIATRGSGGADGMRGGVKLVKDNGSVGVDDKWFTNDTTYGHLFLPRDSEKDDEITGATDISFTDFDLKNVESVADMPIRRDIVDNLMNKNNTNMSLAQFIQEIIHPSAIGINTGNIHVSIRQKAAGNFQVFQATKNWKAKSAEVNEEHHRALRALKYPKKHFLVDYKQQDSLIENIDMSSKFDPAMSLTYERGAAAFAGNPSAIVKFLAYGTVAQDLKEFLDDEDRINNTQLYANVFSYVGEGVTGDISKIEIARNAFFDVPKGDQNKIVSNSVIAKFLMQKPERMNKLNALIQSEPGTNFATQLLSYYMRRCTVTIHGTTNLTPFNSINISGVLPNLEGLYLITSLRESVTTQNFQTIIEAVLLRPKTIEDEGPHDYSDVITN